MSIGPEWLVVWDGMTGQEIDRTPWPSRKGFPSYNFASRNQVAVAFLDGKTPCLLALRGTYNRMKADAWQLVDGKLEQLWTYDNDGLPPSYWGQGAHFTNVADVDNDGRDEVILGSVVLDDNGVPLWTTGKGHPDFAYVGDIDPVRPGLEICFGMETGQSSGGICLADAATGKLFWQLKESTGHVHGKGMCADIDPLEPGLECYGCNAGVGKKPERRWMFAADGELLGMPMSFDFGIRTAWWDADLQKEIVRGHISDYEGGQLDDRIEGNVILVAEVIGDWREEIITSVAGELRIYSTTIPATDRRVCLMQDPIYRADIAMSAMGYTQEPMLTYCPSAISPGLNLTFIQREGKTPAVRVVVSAPLKEAIKGTANLTANEGIELKPNLFEISLEPGNQVEQIVEMSSVEARTHGLVAAQLEWGGRSIRGQVPVRLSSGFLKSGHLVQAEDFAGEEGGKVQLRTDKAATMGKALSHWDDKGHALSWKFEIPAGRYQLVFRYCTPQRTERKLTVDGRAIGTLNFPITGGFGIVAQDWEHLTAAINGKPLILELKKDTHTLRLENTDGQGTNLDYIGLIPQP